MNPNTLFETLSSGLFVIAGPCVIESEALVMEVGEHLAGLQQSLGIPVVFKASYDKANRTSGSSFRGPGLEKGLMALQAVKDRFGLPITTDIHESWQAKPVAEVADVLQIPAFLCRQTDLLEAAAATGKVVNIKKAQFLAGHEMRYPAEKVAESGNHRILLTERGSMFGYQNLVVDFRNLPDMKRFGYPVVMDCTHSVQRPGAAGGKTGGNREFVPSMAHAARMFGADGFFFEVHPDPEKAQSDGPNMLYLKDFEGVLKKLISLQP
jgi:2-dehydro-3-deoxyphosphooctonate aldolase (KDO 8-P synthase)